LEREAPARERVVDDPERFDAPDERPELFEAFEPLRLPDEREPLRELDRLDCCDRPVEPWRREAALRLPLERFAPLLELLRLRVGERFLLPDSSKYSRLLS
jgi:hypothetical protein